MVAKHKPKKLFQKPNKQKAWSADLRTHSSHMVDCTILNRNFWCGRFLTTWTVLSFFFSLSSILLSVAFSVSQFSVWNKAVCNRNANLRYHVHNFSENPMQSTGESKFVDEQLTWHLANFATILCAIGSFGTLTLHKLHANPFKNLNHPKHLRCGWQLPLHKSLRRNVFSSRTHSQPRLTLMRTDSTRKLTFAKRLSAKTRPQDAKN